MRPSPVRLDLLRSRARIATSVIGIVIVILVHASLPARGEETSELPEAPRADVALLDLESLASKHAEAFLGPDFSGLEERFSAAFLAQVSIGALNGQMLAYQLTNGKVASVSYAGKTGPDGIFGDATHLFEIDLVSGRRAAIQMSFDAAGKVHGWWISNGVPKDRDRILRDLRKLPGTVSACVAVAGEVEPRIDVAADETLAIGSTFKLWVLAELLRQCEEGRLALDSVVRLDRAHYSLPSGRLHAWPPGTPMTLHALAIAMISESDNTATDHLIAALGREAIEARLGTLYPCSAPERNVPFLSTRELFALTTSRNAEWRERFLTSDVAARREILAEMARSMSDGTLTLTTTDPRERVFDRLEWFTSTRSLAEFGSAILSPAILRRESTRAALRGVIGVNPGVPADIDAHRITFLGYKGGSEDGVLNFTQIVEITNGKRFTISMTWNRPEGPASDGDLAPHFIALRGYVIDELISAGDETR
jgi:hypothetical protein